MSSEKSPRRLARVKSSAAGSAVLCALPLGAPTARAAQQQHGQRGAERDGDRQHGCGQPGGVEFDERVYGQRVGVVGEDDRRAELAEGAQPGEQQPGADAGQRGGHGDAPEAREAPVPERGGDVLERWVDGGERSTRGDHEEGRGDERLREHDRQARFGQLAVEQPSECRVRSEHVEKQKATHQRWQRERQRDERGEHARAQAPAAREQVGQGGPEQGDHRGRNRRGQQRGGERRADFGRGRDAMAQAQDEGDDRREQVQREQPAEPGQRAARAGDHLSATRRPACAGSWARPTCARRTAASASRGRSSSA